MGDMRNVFLIRNEEERKGRRDGGMEGGKKGEKEAGKEFPGKKGKKAEISPLAGNSNVHDVTGYWN